MSAEKIDVSDIVNAMQCLKRPPKKPLKSATAFDDAHLASKSDHNRNQYEALLKSAGSTVPFVSNGNYTGECPDCIHLAN